MDFFESLQNYLPESEIDKLKEALSKESEHAVLLNTKKMSDQTFLSLFPNVIKHPIVPHAYIYNINDYQLGKTIYHDLGCFYLQEPSAMCVSYFLNPQKEDLVLDLCAAPGGKTIQASLLMDNQGLIIANDLSRKRSSIIVDNVERLGLGNVIVVNNDFQNIYHKYQNTFSKIILDAPCSGSGMFRKDEKMFTDWSYNKVLKFQEIQKQLILMCYDMLKPGGILSYSTCSYSKEENEDVVKYLLSNRQADIINIDSPLLYKSANEPLGVHFFPHLFSGEGHYLCLIKKPGIDHSKIKNLFNLKNKYNLPFNNIDKYGNYLFGINNSFDEKYLNIVRKGVKIGEIAKDKIKFDYHYSHYITSFKSTYELDYEQLKSYILGDVIRVKVPKGDILLTYKGINICIAYSDGNMIKNSYPKHLRKHL